MGLLECEANQCPFAPFRSSGKSICQRSSGSDEVTAQEPTKDRMETRMATRDDGDDDDGDDEQL